jgi:hypothetical protein
MWLCIPVSGSHDPPKQSYSRSESFLTGGIPDLKFDRFTIQVCGSNFLHFEKVLVKGSSVRECT